ncbi:MAG: ribosome silencing factor [Burkholderiaceae bacterium]|nr:ribosome silencing factor [Burkholderiaceae bacterium]
MDPRKLQRVVVDALDDIKAQDVRVFDTTAQTELFDRVIVATGTSNRQTRALAAHVRDKVKQAGAPVVSVEGVDTGEWVLVDLGDIVVHVMQPAIRQYYNLEELWGTKPVRMRAARTPSAAGTQGAAGTPARRAAKGPAGTSAKTPAKRAAKATETASVNAPANPAKKTAAKRAGTKVTAAKHTAAKGTAVKRPATKKSAAKRPAAGRAATKRASNA